MERLLILNPGSTSTKLAVFEGEEPLFVESITHSAEELAPFDCVADQYEFRSNLVTECLNKHGIALDSLTGIVSRGGAVVNAMLFYLQAAMAGETTVGSAMHFRRVGKHEGIVIGDHVFW